MSDLIDRDKLLAAYDAAHKGPPGGARKLIAEAQAVDAAPVRRGHWVNDSDGLPVCPFCDKVAMQRLHCNMLHESWQYDIRLEKTPYCPNCGADLREVENDD